LEIFTIGFTKSSAAGFFGRLKRAGIRKLMDVRLNNRSQLAGFAKRDDLAFFLREICQASYEHQPLLAPSQEMLDEYKKNGGEWSVYEQQFFHLMEQRRIETVLTSADFTPATVLLCSEATADHCHRRLVIEYLQRHWPDIQPVHL
jgi:uncharacterized protein (DUF488 family)